MNRRATIFDRSGLAALSDLDNDVWRDIFKGLEADQAAFLSKADRFRSPDYPWYEDPLHNWSRVWEYAYCRHHLKAWRQKAAGSGLLRVADVGSGVTFFPFAVARLGYHVFCVDPNPVCERDLGRAIPLTPCEPGRVEFRLAGGENLPFQDAELDAVYCISVLEHIPDFERSIEEMARVLKPGGLCLLTIDLDMSGESEIGVKRYAQLVALLKERFKFLFPDATVHPGDILHSNVGPYPIWYDPGPWWRRALRPLWKWIKGARGWKPPMNMACQSFVMVRPPSREA